MRRILFAVLTLAPALAAADESYRYEPTGRTDPFEDHAPAKPADHGAGEVKINEIKVTGIVTGTTDRIAMLEDARGEYIVHEGQHLGPHTVVAHIRDGEVVLAETWANVPHP